MATSSPAAPAGAAETAQCPNCGSRDVQRFCPACGQEARRDLREPIGHLVAEAVGEAISADSRLVHTVPRLLLRPGAVSADYLAGRRARFTSPLKTFLIASFAYFVAAAGRGDAGGRFVVVNVGDRAELKVSAAGSADAEAARQAVLQRIEDRLRDQGRLGRLAAERLDILRALPPAEAGRRIGAHVSENLPRVAFFLVPVLALALRVAFRRVDRWYAEHLVFALYAHATGFLLLLPGAALGSSTLTQLGVAATLAHLVLALRRLHGLPWPGTLVRTAAVCAVYGLALLAGVIVVTIVSVLQA